MSEVYYPQARAILSVVFDGFGVDDGLIDPFNQNNGDSDPTIIQVVPRTAQVNLTGYKEADTWSLSFDAKALPVSPELIRSVNVEVYMFDAKAVNPEVAGFAQPEFMLVAGLADNASIRYGSSGRELTCDGRDYTALLIDKHWDPRVPVPVGLPLTAAVQQVVDIAVQSKTHAGRTLTVEYVSQKPVPIVGQYHTKTTKRGKPVKKGESAWDVVYKMCLAEGMVVFVRGFTVMITDPQTLTLQNANKARKVAYGRNLSSLKVDRKLGKEKVPQVVVSSYSSRQRKAIKAVFPEQQDPVNTGIGTKKDEQAFFVLNGVDDVALLKRYAEMMYNNLARGEARIHFTTRSMTDLTDDIDATVGPLGALQFTHRTGLDMLQLRAGDPVVVGFDPFNEVLMESSSPQQRYTYLIEQGYSSTVATLISLEFDKLDQFKRPFYTREVQLSWDHKEGLTIDVDAVNFVALQRDDATAKGNPAMANTKMPKSTDNSAIGDDQSIDDGETDEGGL